MPAAEKALVWLLRLGAAILLLAFFTMLLPVEWMASTHRRLGLGEFPASPLVDYLTRSVSALYALHGGVLLAVSLDVRRHRPLVLYLGWVKIPFGLALLGIGLHAGLPGWWVANEGPYLVLIGIAILLLARRVPRGHGPRQASPADSP